MLNSRFTCIAASALLLTTMWTQTAQAERLREALRHTYQNNPQLQAARARLRAIDELTPQALSNHMPKVGLSGDYGLNKKYRSVSSGGNSKLYPGNVELTVSQPLFRGFRTLHAVKKAKASIRAGRQNLKNTEQSVLLEAITAYMDVLRDSQVVKHRRRNIDGLRRHLRAARRRLQVGAASKTDEAQARLRLARSRAELGPARGRLQASRARYASIVGHAPSRLRLPRLHKSLRPRTLSEAIDQAAELNPVILEARHAEEAARNAINEVKGELLPTVNIEASYAWKYNYLTRGNRERDMTIMGRVHMPLYQGGGVVSRIRQARQTRTQRRYEASNSQAQTQARVISAWEQIAAARSQIRAGKAEVSAARQALKGVRKEYLAGQRTMLDVLDATQELTSAKISLSNGYHDKGVAHYTLLAAVGVLTSADLRLDAQPYRPEINRKRVQYNLVDLGLRLQILPD